MNTYFLRTVPDASSADIALRDRLKMTVSNTGNYFFEEAVFRQLDGHTTIRRIADLPNDAGALVLSMSNFISPATDLGWLADAIEKSKVERVVMIGAGAQAESFAHGVKLGEGTSRFVSILSERSASIGVRGYFTAEVLARAGIKNVDVIGCPSMFLNCDRTFAIRKRDIGDRKMKTVTHFTPSGYYRDAISHLLGFAVRECVGYIAQSETHLLYDEEGADRRAFFFKYYNNGEFEPQRLDDWMKRHVRWFFDLKTWFAYMKDLDFSVGARFHGNMAALQVGVPALNLVCDSRTRELCEYLNLPYEFLKDFDGRRTARDIYEMTDFTLFNATYAEKYDAYRAFLERNGLAHKMGGAAEHFEDASAPVRIASVVELLKNCKKAGVDLDHVVREMMRRIELDRSEMVMKLAESGKYDVRTAVEG